MIGWRQATALRMPNVEKRHRASTRRITRACHIADIFIIANTCTLLECERHIDDGDDGRFHYSRRRFPHVEIKLYFLRQKMLLYFVIDLFTHSDVNGL